MVRAQARRVVALLRGSPRIYIALGASQRLIPAVVLRCTLNTSTGTCVILRKRDDLELLPTRQYFIMLANVIVALLGLQEGQRGTSTSGA